jgi:hypothetical protein
MCEPSNISQTYEGTWHDKAICDTEQYTFPELATLQKDCVFHGCAPKGVIAYQTKKKPCNGALSIADEPLNREIASLRIVVDHVLPDVKRCRIVNDVFRNTRIGIKNRELAIMCDLNGFRQRLRLKKVYL